MFEIGEKVKFKKGKNEIFTIKVSSKNFATKKVSYLLEEKPEDLVPEEDLVGVKKLKKEIELPNDVIEKTKEVVEEKEKEEKEIIDNLKKLNEEKEKEKLDKLGKKKITRKRNTKK